MDEDGLPDLTGHVIVLLGEYFDVLWRGFVTEENIMGEVA